VLLIGVANLISLQIARNGAREREISVRVALGATRGRLIRQLVTESLLLGLAGAAIGFAIAVPAVTLILSTLPAGFPRADQVAVNWVIAFFAVGVSLVCGVVVGLVPAWQAARADLAPRLTEGGRSATLSDRRARVQRTLIVLETAAALMLLIGAGLMANSFQRLISRDAGMLEEGLWVIRGSLPNRGRPRGELQRTAVWRRH
jgi:putative ABC transport system permease protein